MPTRNPSLLQPPIGFAHRGARSQLRENTLDAFDLAIRLGASGLESDVWITSDGVVILDHDGKVGRRPWRKDVSTVSREVLPRHIPTLDEFYSQVGVSLPVSLDLKDPSAFAPTVAVARRHGALANLWLCHTDIEVLSEFRTAEPAVRLVHSTRKKWCAQGLERHIAQLAEAKVDALNMPQQDWTAGNVALAHRFERYAFAWDAQLDRILIEMLNMGIDGVYSDWSDRMADAFEQLAIPR